MILMDTHIWLRWILPGDPLPPKLIALINSSATLAVSSISCWEVVLLNKWHKIELPLTVNEWLDEALKGSNVTALPITSDISICSGLLPYHHKDPADRFIIATAIQHNINLISIDSQFPAYDELKDLLINEN